MEVDKALGSSRIDCEFSGSTAVVSFLKGKTLTTAWVGDSRGVLARANKKSGYLANALTTDHKPLLPEEKSRIESSNGRVERYIGLSGWIVVRDSWQVLYRLPKVCFFAPAAFTARKSSRSLFT